MWYPTGLSCVGGGITQGGNRALDKRMDDTCLWGLISSFFSKQSSIISSIEHKTQCFLSCHEPVHVDTSLLMSLIICVYFISFTDFAHARNHKKKPCTQAYAMCSFLIWWPTQQTGTSLPHQNKMLLKWGISLDSSVCFIH